jgi:hypothetical protein
MTRALLTDANVMTRPIASTQCAVVPCDNRWRVGRCMEGMKDLLAACLYRDPNRERARTRRTLFFVAPCCVAKPNGTASLLRRTGDELRTGRACDVRRGSEQRAETTREQPLSPDREPNGKWLASSRPSQRRAPPAVRASTRDHGGFIGRGDRSIARSVAMLTAVDMCLDGRCSESTQRIAYLPSHSGVETSTDHA